MAGHQSALVYNAFWIADGSRPPAGGGAPTTLEVVDHTLEPGGVDVEYQGISESEETISACLALHRGEGLGAKTSMEARH